LTRDVERSDEERAGVSNGTDAGVRIGGTDTYCYRWSRGGRNARKNNSAPGSYTLTVTDENGCEATSNFRSAAGPVICDDFQLSLSQEGVRCAGEQNGRVSAVVSGGIAPYSYQWSNSATTPNQQQLAAGNYTLTVTDKVGCELVESIAIISPTELRLRLTPNDGLCGADAVINSRTTGGSLPYSYRWSNGNTTANIEGMNAGEYTLTVTDDNGCTINQAATVALSPAVTAEVIKQDVSCAGAADGAFTVEVKTGVAPYTYSWSNGDATDVLRDLSPGDYVLQVTDDEGCSFIASYKIQEPEAMGVAFNTTMPSSNTAGDGVIVATANGGVMPYRYQWSNGVTTARNRNLTNGTYFLTCLLYTSPSPRDRTRSRMPSSA